MGSRKRRPCQSTSSSSTGPGPSATRSCRTAAATYSRRTSATSARSQSRARPAILGCAENHSLIQLEALIADAFAARKVTDQALDELAARAGRTPGARKLRLLRKEGVKLTRSEAERILRRLLEQAGLPQPATDYPIGRYFADFAWPRHRLVVEFDGFATHGHKQAFTPDRKRGGDITVKNWSVMHVTWDELIDEPLSVVARIAGALAVREAA